MSWFMMAVASEDHWLIVVTIFDMSQRLWGLLRMYQLATVVINNLSVLVLFDGTGTLGRMATAASIAVAVWMWAVFLVVGFGSAALTVDMLTAGLALPAAVLTLRYGCDRLAL
jgi:hypothetical protein